MIETFQPIEKVMHGLDSIQFTNLSEQAMSSVNYPDLFSDYNRFSYLLYRSKKVNCGFNHFLEVKGIRHDFVREYKPQRKCKVKYLKIFMTDYFVKIGLEAPFAMTFRFCINKFINKTRHNLILRSCNMSDVYNAMVELSKSFMVLLDEYRNSLPNESDRDLCDKMFGRWQVMNFSMSRLDFTFDIYFKESQYKQQFIKQVSNVRIPDYSCGNIDDVSVTFMPSSKQNEKSIPKIKIYDKQGDVIKHYPECSDAIVQSKNVARFEFQLRRAAIRKKFSSLSIYNFVDVANDEFNNKSVSSIVDVEKILPEYFNTLVMPFFAHAKFDEKKVLQFMRSHKYLRAFAFSRSVLGACDHLKVSSVTMRKHLRILAELGLVRGNSKWDWAQLTDEGLQFTQIFKDGSDDVTTCDVISFIMKCIGANVSRKGLVEQAYMNSLSGYYSDILNSIALDQSRNIERYSTVSSSSSVSDSLETLILAWLKNAPDGVAMFEIISKFGQKSENVLDALMSKCVVFEPKPGMLRLMYPEC